MNEFKYNIIANDYKDYLQYIALLGYLPFYDGIMVVLLKEKHYIFLT